MSNVRPAAIDTHAHLDDEQFGDEVGAVIERAVMAGVHRIVNIGFRPDKWRSTLALAETFPEVDYALGLHPHHAEEWSPLVESELRTLLTATAPVALGEIGLDYVRNINSKELQCRVFERQLQIAEEAALPVIIHQRGAEADLIHILGNAPPGLGCVLHSFDGTEKLAEFASARGYFVGVGGLMTRPNSGALRAVLKDVPVGLFLLETDAPYLVPSGVKQRRNEPANIPTIAHRLADLTGMPVDRVIAQCTENAERLFGTLANAGSLAPAMRPDAGT